MKKNIYSDLRFMILFAVICTFLWGCAFPAVKTGYVLFGVASDDTASQILFAGVRFFLAGVVTLIAAAVTERGFPRVSRKNIGKTVLLGMLQTGLQYFCFYIGMAHTTGTRGSIFNASSTFMTVLFVGIVWHKTDPITPRKLLGCLVGFAGVVLVNFSGATGGSFTFLGDGMVLLSSACLAFAAPLTKAITQTDAPLTVTGWQLSAGGLVLLLAGFLSGGRLQNAGPVGLALLAFMVMITAVAFPIWSQLLKNNPISRVAVFNFLIPVFGVALSGILLGEGFPGVTCLAALALVCAGIVLVNGEKVK